MRNIGNKYRKSFFKHPRYNPYLLYLYVTYLGLQLSALASNCPSMHTETTTGGGGWHAYRNNQLGTGIQKQPLRGHAQIYNHSRVHAYYRINHQGSCIQRQPNHAPSTRTETTTPCSPKGAMSGTICFETGLKTQCNAVGCLRGPAVIQQDDVLLQLTHT